MSDHSISIVPRRSSYPENKEKANEFLKWLVSLDIVAPTPSDCILSSDNGYAISNGARNVTNHPDDLPFDFITNGLEVITERQVFHTGENGIEELICPHCNQNIPSENLNFLGEWCDNKSNNLTCPLCDVATDIQNFKFTPEWGFSNLGFSFWNWPELTNSFINDFKKKLGCDVNLVFTWI